MKGIKGIFKNLHRYVLWLTVSFFFWAWIFTILTNAPAGKKLVFYADCPAMEREALSEALEEDMPENIRFVEARVFSDEMFQPTNLTLGDVYILSSAQIDRYIENCIPIDPAAFPDRPLYERDGTVYGVCVWDESLDVAVATKYVAYYPGERYYLFFNAASKHLGAWNGSADDAGLRAAERFLTLP